MKFLNKNSAPMVIEAMCFTASGIVKLLTLSAFFLITACHNSPSGIEGKADLTAVPEPSIESTINTRHSENQAEPQQGSLNETINIGLIVSTQVSKSELAQAARHGVELALSQANKAGGYDHRDYRLLIRSCDGPWGVAAKEAVSLITDFNVKAILTSLDGRNAHLIEQVATKTKVIMLSSRAGDPTLSQAFVPWYFRCVPNDNQQAEALTDELVNKRKLSDFMVVSENSYDGRLASGSFITQLKKMDLQSPEQFLYDQRKPDFNSLIEQIKKTGINYIVLFGGSENSLRFIKRLSETGKKYIIFGPFSVIGENNNLKEFWDCADNMVLTSADFWFISKGKKFQDVFQKTYGYLPGPVAAYAYDGANVLIEAIEKGGLVQEGIIHSMSEIKYEGVTGIIQFDDKGNRKGKPGFMAVKHGIPVLIRRNN